MVDVCICLLRMCGVLFFFVCGGFPVLLSYVYCMRCGRHSNFLLRCAVMVSSLVCMALSTFLALLRMYIISIVKALILNRPPTYVYYIG